jgi:hypothetical protein
MTDEMKGEPERDESLSSLLAQWAPPYVPESLDERVLASYRRSVGATPSWRRLLSTSVRVPLPVALVALLLLLFSAAVALRQAPASRPDEPQLAGASEPTRSARSDDQPVVTRTSLAGFEPVTDMNVTVVRGGVRQ